MSSEIRDTWLARRATEAPHGLALRAEGRDITWAELEAKASDIAERMRGEGAEPSTVIPLQAEGTVEFVASFHACAKLGAIAAPHEAKRRSTPPIGGTQRRLPPEGALCRLYTSGTSGEPSAVDLTRSNFEASAAGSAGFLGIEPGDRWLCCLPLVHVAAISILTRSAIYGTGVVLHDGFDVDRVAASLADDGVTLVSLVPTQILRLAEAGVDLSGPRAIIAGGGPVPREVVEAAHSRGGRVVESYGMTETTSQVTLDGVPLTGAEIELDDVGEILVRGPVVAPGSAAEDGWLHTGDIGEFDAGGRLRIVGRRGDTIITGGENVRPEPVEAVLRAHPGVADAAVIGRPDPEWQEAVTAVLVLAAGPPPLEAELREWCAERLARHQVPKRFELAAELPRTASGKTRRAALRG